MSVMIPARLVIQGVGKPHNFPWDGLTGIIGGCYMLWQGSPNSR
jgi:hypothetical protein